MFARLFDVEEQLHRHADVNLFGRCLQSHAHVFFCTVCQRWPDSGHWPFSPTCTPLSSLPVENERTQT